jgi:hypothetical protein
MSEKIKKYPRTFHLTFSKGCTNDDKMLDSDDYFIGEEIILTSKLDGSNFCMTNSECFARTHSGPPTHKSFDLAKSIHSQIKFFIPDNFAIFSEYLFAKHSIHYRNLPHYLAIFNILDFDRNVWLSWNDVEMWSGKINVPTVPVLFRGLVKTNYELQELCLSFMGEKEFQIDEREGIVIRLSKEFDNINFDFSTGKMVRANHVQTSDHWKDQEIIRNKLKI